MAMADRPGAAESRGSVRWWAALALGWSFLTVLPSPWVETDSRALAGAVALFPVLGIALGAALGGLGLALDLILPPGPVAVLLLMAGALATGGLHLDGAMDTADGVFGGRAVERRLEIMKDSRIGAFGAIAGGLILLGQYAALSGLVGMARLVALILALALARWAMVVAIVAFPAARPTGLGATFHQAAGRWTLAGATVVAVVVALATGRLGLVSFGGAVVVALLGGRFLAGRLGGLTGDTYGALAVATETLVLYLAVVRL